MALPWQKSGAADAQSYRPAHLLPCGPKEWCTTQGWYSPFAPFSCYSPHRKRRGTTSGTAFAGAREPDDYSVLSPCDCTKAERGAVAFGSHRHKLHSAIVTRAWHLGLIRSGSSTWRRSVHWRTAPATR